MWYLCFFYHRLLDYRKAEVESLAQLFCSEDEVNDLQWRLPLHHHQDSPFHFVNLPSEDVATKIANRSQFNSSFIGLHLFIAFFLGGFALFDAKWRLSVVLGKTQISEVVVYVWILFFVMGASVVLQRS